MANTWTDSPCVEWQGARTHGYGVRRRYSRETGTTLVHRQAWVMAHGLIPDGLVVMHLCDNRPCYNLAHLRLGTVADNQADMAAKGRSKLGKVYSPNCRHCGKPKRLMAGRYRCRCRGGWLS